MRQVNNIHPDRIYWANLRVGGEQLRSCLWNTTVIAIVQWVIKPPLFTPSYKCWQTLIYVLKAENWGMAMLKKETQAHTCTDHQPIFCLSSGILSHTDLKQTDLLLLLNWGQISTLKAQLYCWACLLFMILEDAMVTWAMKLSLGCFMRWISSPEL